jgi:hypothetical protein
MVEIRRKSPVAANWAAARMERAERTKTEGYVYFIACGPFIKIGYSFDHPRRRLDEMLTGNPVQAEKRLARLIAYRLGDGVLSEGQVARIIEVDRRDVRQMRDECTACLDARPLTGVWGGAAEAVGT